MIRWISYTSQNIPGGQGFTLGFCTSLSEAVEAHKEFCEGVGTTDCNTSLYAVPLPSQQYEEHFEMIESAKKYADIGCPFDYPDRIIESGPRGGVKVMNT
jgi:hypothetical protein